MSIKPFFKKIFSISDIDGHYIVFVFGIQIRLKHNVTLNPPEIKSSGVTEHKRNPRLIVTLTTFPARINAVSKTISTLLNQTLKPDEIILWLANEQFPNRELPTSLTDLQQYGLSIRWCSDTRSFKKLVPALKEFQNDILITVDDDIYYKEDTIETLYNSYLKYPKEIHAHRAGRLFFNKEGTLRDSGTNKLYWSDYSNKSFYNSMIGCGGVLYPPHSLYQDVIREDIFKRVIPTQDDIWFWAMAVLNGTRIRVVKGYSEPIYTIEDTQQHGLCKINENHLSGMSRNEALDAIVKEYPELVDILRGEKCK